MFRKMKSNWPIVTLLLVLGALPAIPGVFILKGVLNGPDIAPGSDAFLHISGFYFAAPAPIMLHIIFGILFCIAVPFQFSAAIRQRWPVWHRIGGRVVLVSGIVLGLSTLWMIHFYPLIGNNALKYSVMMISSLGIILSLGLALFEVKRRNIPQHRAWMMRAVAITFGGSSAAIFMIPYFLMFGEPSQIASAASRWIGLILTLCIVEYILCRAGKPMRKEKGRILQNGA